MSCNNRRSGPCCPDTPYPQVSHESVPSLIDNLVNALYGNITKKVSNGRVIWNIPCDPSDNPVTIDGFPRLLGEGLLCYIIRYFDNFAPILLDAVTISGAQTILGQKTFTLPVLGDAVNNTLSQTIAGNKTFNWIKLPVGTTGTRPTGQTGLIRFNTDSDHFEGYNNTTWSSIGASELIYSDTMPVGYPGLEWVDTTTMKRYQWYSDSWIETFGGNNGVTTGGGTGTVTSVALTLPSIMTVSGSPVTSSGTLAGGLATQTANTAFLAPNGSNGTPTFRALVAADIPTLNQNTTGNAANVTGIVALANGGTGSSLAGGARTNLGAAASGANTDITSVSLTSGTISSAPANASDIVNRGYVDTIASGINFHPAANYATTAALSLAYTYSNGTSGVGATITCNANNTSLVIDGKTFTTTDVTNGTRILIKNESGLFVSNTTPSAAFNGVYTFTRVEATGVAWQLTRATDYDTSGTGTNEIDAGDFILVLSGVENQNSSWVQQTLLPITVGTTSIVFIQFAAPGTAYTAGTGLTLSANQFSVTTVPAGNGGTGQTAYSVGDILYASSSNALSKLADVATGSALISGGIGSIPSYGKIGLQTHVSGILPVANGGTGDTLASGARTNLVAQKAFTFVDTTPPSSPTTNDIWIDTASLRQYTYTGSVWAEI